MLGRLFIALSNLPGLKKRLWRTWYDYLAGKHRASDWTFMNYGYFEAATAPIHLDAADEADRCCIQLYHHVAGAADLKGLNVLEVGCGRGGGASFIKRYLKPSTLTGVDLSENALDFCRKTHRIAGLEFRSGDAEHLPFSEGSLDAVINVESSHCYPDFGAFLLEVRRVLRPGGHFLYADFRGRSNVKSWREALQTSGFVVVREMDITSNVIAALDLDNDRKVALIERLIPRPLRNSFNDFAAVRGSAVYNGFQSGELVYMNFVLKKPEQKVFH